jgi:hypothetical protein
VINKNLGNKDFMKQLVNLTKHLEPSQRNRVSLPLPKLTAEALKNPLILGLQQQLSLHQDTFEDSPEFQKVVEHYNNILMLLLQTLNDIIEMGSNHSSEEDYDSSYLL